MKLYIINGPNLNFLGIREPEHYGNTTYEELLAIIGNHAKELGIEVVCYQSNHEGALVDKIQEALGEFDAIVFNPAAYTHTSVAIHDALLAVAIPTAEVHLTDTTSREDYRKVNFITPCCEKTFQGHGFDSYRMAIEYMVEKYR